MALNVNVQIVKDGIVSGVGSLAVYAPPPKNTPESRIAFVLSSVVSTQEISTQEEFDMLFDLETDAGFLLKKCVLRRCSSQELSGSAYVLRDAVFDCMGGMGDLPEAAA